MTARDVWRWTDERGVQRLVGTDELRAALATAILPATTLVWRDGMKEWAPASSVPELASAAFAAASASSPPPKNSDINDSWDPRGTAKERERRATLVGLSSSPGEITEVRVPVAPSRATADPAPPGPVTQIPPFGAPAPDTLSEALLRAPRVPMRPVLSAKPKPARRITSHDLDSSWATTTNSDEDETIPRRARPSELAAAAAAAAALRANAGQPTQTRKPPPLPPVGARGETAAERDAKPSTNGSASPAASPVDKAAGPGASTPRALPKSNRPPPPQAIPSMSIPATPAVPAVRLKAPGGDGITGVPRSPIITLRGVPPLALSPEASVVALPASNKASVGAAPVARPSPPRKPPPRGAPGPVASSGQPTKTLQSARDSIESFPGLADAIADADDEGDAAVTGLRTSPLEASDLDAVSYDDDDARPALASVASPAAGNLGDALPRPLSQEATAPLPLPQLLGAQDARSPVAPFPLAAEESTVPNGGANEAAAAPSVTGAPALGLPAVVAPSPAAPSDELPSAAAPFAKATPPPSAVDRDVPSAVPAASRADPSGRASSPFLATHDPDDADALRRGRLDEQVAVPLSSLLGAGGLLIGMVVTAFFVGRASSRSVATLTAHPTLASVPALARAALPAPPKPCWMAKQPAMWAPAASRTIPFEATATTTGTLAIGYARDTRQAVGVEVDLATGEVKSRLDDKAKEEIERVVPLPTVDFRVARAGATGPLRSPIDVPLANPFAIGLAEGGIGLSAPPEAPPKQLWALPGDEGLGAASVRAAGDRGFALVFRRSASVWGGFVGADRRASSELVKIAGSGGAVGKPAVAWNGREVAVIFADRPEADGHYEIRIGHGPAGTIPATTAVLPLPRGGPGGDAFAPDIAGLPDGRWLLMWTEGGAGARAVRAQTLSPDFRPLGDPIALSPPAGNFGQGVIGVVGPYAATVFLSKGASAYELWGAVLQCGG